MGMVGKVFGDASHMARFDAAQRCRACDPAQTQSFARGLSRVNHQVDVIGRGARAFAHVVGPDLQAALKPFSLSETPPVDPAVSRDAYVASVMQEWHASLEESKQQTRAQLAAGKAFLANPKDHAIQYAKNWVNTIRQLPEQVDHFAWTPETVGASIGILGTVFWSKGPPSVDRFGHFKNRDLFLEHDGPPPLTVATATLPYSRRDLTGSVVIPVNAPDWPVYSGKQVYAQHLVGKPDELTLFVFGQNRPSDHRFQGLGTRMNDPQYLQGLERVIYVHGRDGIEAPLSVVRANQIDTLPYWQWRKDPLRWNQYDEFDPAQLLIGKVEFDYGWRAPTYTNKRTYNNVAFDLVPVRDIAYLDAALGTPYLTGRGMYRRRYQWELENRGFDVTRAPTGHERKGKVWVTNDYADLFHTAERLGMNEVPVRVK